LAKPVSAATWGLAFFAVVLITVAFRFFRVGSVPVGLQYDEAFNGLDASALLSRPLTHWPIFFPDNFGREPLFVYLLAATQALLGPGVMPMHLLSATIGTLLTPAVAWLAWEMAPSLRLDGKRLALWAAIAPLTLLWVQILSRYATRTLPLALLETLMWAALWRGWRTRRRCWWVTSGALAGLSFYTYLAVRLLPAVFMVMLLAAIVWNRAELRRRLPDMGAWLLVAALVAAPLAMYLLAHPASLFTRVSQVSILKSGPLAIARNVLAVLGMVFIAGDRDIRNNIPGRPALDGIASIWFAVGLAWSLWQLRRPAYLFLLTWAAVMLAPAMLSNNAPSFQRAVGALPPLLLLMAVGLERGVSWAERTRPTLATTALGLALLSLAASAGITWHAFYDVWAGNESLFYARDAGLLELTEALKRELAAAAPSATTYLSPSGWDHPTVRYGLLGVLPQNELLHFDGSRCVRIPDGAARYLLRSADDPRGPRLLSTYLPDSSSHVLVVAPDGRPWAVELDQPAHGRVVFPEMTPLLTGLDDGISLIGYWLSSNQLRPGDRLYVRLFWRANHTPAREYTAFIHLLATAPGKGAMQVAGADAPPGNGSCGTSTWLPGETVIDEFELTVPGSLSPGYTYSLATGFYTANDGRRLHVPGSDDDTIPLARLPLAQDQP